MVIKRIGVLKLAIFQCVMMVAFGLIAALVLLGFSSMLGGINHDAAMAGMIGGIAALIILPIMYGAFGFIAGAVVAAIYNLVASIVGGIEIDVE